MWFVLKLALLKHIMDNQSIATTNPENAAILSPAAEHAGQFVFVCAAIAFLVFITIEMIRDYRSLNK